MDPRLAPNPYNPFADAMDHAQTQMKIMQGQQSLDQQSQYLQMAKEDHKLNVGTKMYDTMDRIQKMGNPKVKGSMADIFNDNVKRINGVGLEPSFLADLKSNESSAQLANYMSSLGDPDLPWDKKQELLKKLPEVVSQEDAHGIIDKQADEAKAFKLQKMKGDAEIEAARLRGGQGEANRTVRTTLSAQKEFDNITKNTNFRLEGTARILNVLQGAEDGKYATNGALANQINNELTRLESGTNIIADRNQRANAMDTYKQELGDFLQKITAKPQDSVDPAIIKQTASIIGELKDSYMDQFDRQHQVLRAGALPNQVAVFDSKAEATRKAYGPKFGGWLGQPQEKADIPPAKVGKVAQGPQEINFQSMSPQKRTQVMSQLKSLAAKGTKRADIEKELGKKIPDAVASSLFKE